MLAWVIDFDGAEGADADVESEEGVVESGEDPWVGRLAEAKRRGEEVYHGVAQCHGCHPGYVTPDRLREIRGDWRAPSKLLHYNGRLYLSERSGVDEGYAAGDYTDDGTWSEEKEAAGHRIFVLTPQGQTLQIYTGNDMFVQSMAVFGKKLLVDMGNGQFITLRGI